ncbi:MAG: tetraacyldisaccharide 4'-kinase [Waddliaceae bacterium]
MKRIKNLIFQKLELYWVSLVNGRQGKIHTFLRLMLTPFASFYGTAVSLRNWLYDQGWKRTYHAPVPCVISIGNLVLGGTGKTPITLKLAEIFSDRYSVAILSRGYGSCDEPLLFKNRLKNVQVLVGKNRTESANIASKSGVKLILLDDGFQHRRLARDINLVTLQADDPFGKGHLFPRGFLREPPLSLKRADLILINHKQNRDIDSTALHQALSRWTNAPIIDFYHRPEGIFTLSGESIDSIQGKKVGAFCGIANPERFQSTLESLGAEVVYFHPLSDHAELTPKQLAKICKKAEENGAELVLCTEKDAVKLNPSDPVAYVKMGIEIVNEEKWQKLISKIETFIEKR